MDANATAGEYRHARGSLWFGTANETGATNETGTAAAANETGIAAANETGIATAANATHHNK